MNTQKPTESLGEKPFDLSTLSGLAGMQLMIDGLIPNPPIAKTMNFWLIAVAKGEAVFEGAPGPEVCNPMGGVHGGWYGAILDSALGCAVHTEMAPGAVYTTLEYKVNITRAIPVGMKVRATGNTLHVGRSTAVSEAKIVGVDDGRIYATGSTTCIILTQAK
ncbi:MAG: hypothetical protein ACI8YI_002479 [Paracoccaceae bacterium]|jgi:uncharacterized protein (TIGR00369 family)